MTMLGRAERISKVLTTNRVPTFRLRQVFDAIYKKHEVHYSKLSSVPRSIRDALVEEFGNTNILALDVLQATEAENAHKVLFRPTSLLSSAPEPMKCGTRSLSRFEAVSLRFPTHRSLCISCQVGCAFACSFCATGKLGLKHQLGCDHITDQVLYFLQQGQRINSISFMGMGEPFANPKVFEAIKFLRDERYFGFSARSINVSTIGLIPGIIKLNQEEPQVNLTFSLHSAFPDERLTLMPIQKSYPLDKVFDVLDQRILQTGRRIWIAYLMLQGKNDTEEHANKLADIIRSRSSDVRYLYHVNLLPYNLVKEQSFVRTESSTVDNFAKRLKFHGISCSYRNSFGHSIDAACGQLYAGYGTKTLSLVGGK